MNRGQIGGTIIFRDTLSSTMDEARRLSAAGAVEGTVVVADHQTAGRGRAGRSWMEQPGDGLLMSVILRPTLARDCLSTVPLIAGDAVAEALEAVAPVTCQLKWPNDVWVDDRKIAGILVTSHQDDASLVVIAGIGVNLNTPAERLEDGATSLAMASGHAIARDKVLEAVCRCLDAAYRQFHGSGGVANLSTWRHRAVMIGERVSIVQDGLVLTGRYIGIGDDGTLLLETATGTCHVVAGDLVRGPVVVP